MTSNHPQVVVNEVGDVVVTEGATMLALADQDRLALLTRLQRHGPAAVGDLAIELEVSEGELVERLEVLAGVGLVHDGSDGWAAGRPRDGASSSRSPATPRPSTRPVSCTP